MLTRKCLFGASGKGLFWLGTAPVCIQYLFKSSNLVQEIEFRGRNKASQSVFFIIFFMLLSTKNLTSGQDLYRTEGQELLAFMF